MSQLGHPFNGNNINFTFTEKLRILRDNKKEEERLGGGFVTQMILLGLYTVCVIPLLHFMEFYPEGLIPSV